MLLEVRQETKGPFQVATVILGFLSNFKKNQESSPFEALHSTCCSRCQRYVRTPVEMRRAPWALSKVSRGDSDIPTSCEMKDEPAFKPLQGNLVLSIQDISVSIPLEAANPGSLSHAYC